MKTSVRLFSFALAALIVWGCTACSGDTAPSDVSGNAATSAASALGIRRQGGEQQPGGGQQRCSGAGLVCRRDR